MAIKIPDLKAAIPYYRKQPSNEDAVKIKAPLLLQYVVVDKRVNSGWPDFETILKKTTLRMKLIFSLKLIKGFITILLRDLIKKLQI